MRFLLLLVVPILLSGLWYLIGLLTLGAFGGADRFRELQTLAERSGQLPILIKLKEWKRLVWTILMLLVFALVFVLILWLVFAEGLQAMPGFKRAYGLMLTAAAFALIVLVVLFTRYKARDLLNKAARADQEIPSEFHICRVKNPKRISNYRNLMLLTGIMLLVNTVLIFADTDLNPALTLTAWIVLFLIIALLIRAIVKENRKLTEMMQISARGIRCIAPFAAGMEIPWDTIERIAVAEKTIEITLKNSEARKDQRLLPLDLNACDYAPETLSYMLRSCAPEGLMISG